MKRSDDHALRQEHQGGKLNDFSGEHNSTAARPIPPARLPVAVAFFAASSLLFFFMLYRVLPALLHSEIAWFAAFNIVLVLPMVLLLVAALFAYRLEGRPFLWPALCDRFRLRQMSGTTWLWTAALAVFMYGGRFALPVTVSFAVIAIALERRQTGAKLWMVGGLGVFIVLSWALWHPGPWLAQVPLHREPPYIRDLLNRFGPENFMDIPLRGHWWIAIYYTAVLLLANIGGEELWWRGYLLPRQEKAQGSIAWLVHGVLWASFHLFFQWTLWDLVRMIPTCCALSFVAQYQKNTWPGIIAHTFGNGALWIQIVRGISG
ncbi:MAG: CPBP family intramembrane metalloprotease [Acidobacteriota bacterium]|nr:CPBP family intramembrane metalloprotease [Acidobacteriota bacterium]